MLEICIGAYLDWLINEINITAKTSLVSINYIISKLSKETIDSKQKAFHILWELGDSSHPSRVSLVEYTPILRVLSPCCRWKVDLGAKQCVDTSPSGLSEEFLSTSI